MLTHGFTKKSHNDVYDAIDPRKGMKDTAKGRSIIVTGGSKGIGKGIATSFALAGAKAVIIAARSASQLEETKKEIESVAPKTKVLAIPADLTSASAVDSLYETIKKEGIIVDVLINNAGAMSPFVTIKDVDPTAWWNEMSIHIQTTFLMTRGFLRQLPPNPQFRPTIICTSSVGGVEPGTVKPGSSAYCVAKLALVRFTEFVAVENPDVRAFVYHPGGVMTDLVSGAFPADALKSGFWSDTPELAGGYCLWMCTDRADFMRNRYGRYSPRRPWSYANGSVNWDVDELESKKDEILKKDLLKMLPVLS